MQAPLNPHQVSLVLILLVITLLTTLVAVLTELRSTWVVHDWDKDVGTNASLFIDPCRWNQLPPPVAVHM